MANPIKEFPAYVCFHRPNDTDNVHRMMISSSVEEIGIWKEEKRFGGDATKTSKDRVPGQVDTGNSDNKATDAPTAQLSVLMKRFKQAISSYHVLASASLSLVPAMKAIYITNEIIPQAQKTMEQVEIDGSFITYGVDSGLLPILSRHSNRLDEMTEASSVLPGAILLSLVATFDSLIVDIIRVMLRHRKDLIEGSGKSFTVPQILSMSSFEEVIKKVVEDEISDVMRGSHRDQVKYIEKSFNIEFPKDHTFWGSFLEIFERRNLVAHGDLIVNDIYISNCKTAGYDVSKLETGQRLRLSQKYIFRSSDILIEIGIEIICLLWKKNFPNDIEDAYEDVNEICFDLLRTNRTSLATRLLEFSIGKRKPKMSDRLLKTMTINLASAYKHKGDINKVRETLSSIDWTATSSEFKICIASLNDNVGEFIKIMPRVISEGTVEIGAFRDWPVFKWMREQPQVAEKFREIYGEEIFVNSRKTDNDGTLNTNSIETSSLAV